MTVGEFMQVYRNGKWEPATGLKPGVEYRLRTVGRNLFGATEESRAVVRADDGPSPATPKMMEHLRKIAAAEDEERERMGERAVYFRGFAGRGIARILWPDSKGWEKVSRRGSTPAGGAMGATMPMKGARAAWELCRRGLVVVESTDHHQSLFRVSHKGRAVLNPKSEDGSLDPQPWLFISDQVFGEIRSDHDKGYHDVSGTWWAFKPREEYEQDQAKYPTTNHVDRSTK
jgi:hypothetical protein